MQTDMHYYGTYAMARAAGLVEDIARAIATAAEYVDDSDRLKVTLTDGKVIESEPTAHHPIDAHNLEPNDQRRTWIPFHFIPGNEGANDAERLVCRLDSAIAQEMVKHNLTIAVTNNTYGVLLLGITAHVYADTFAHYGFSGISSSVNKVYADSFHLELSDATHKAAFDTKYQSFVDQYIKGAAANFLAQLGHGSVATYPDQPFLKWSFTYENRDQKSGLRDNPKTFLQACAKLHLMFSEFNQRTDGMYDDPEAKREFNTISEDVAKVLAVEGEQVDRIAAWQTAVIANRIYNNPTSQPIPMYDSSRFTTDLKALHTYDSAKASQTLVCAFLDASNVHRNYVLNELLPKYNISVNHAPLEWLMENLI
jgi:hypothetical protein